METMLHFLDILSMASF